MQPFGQQYIVRRNPTFQNKAVYVSAATAHHFTSQHFFKLILRRISVYIQNEILIGTVRTRHKTYFHIAVLIFSLNIAVFAKIITIQWLQRAGIGNLVTADCMRFMRMPKRDIIKTGRCKSGKIHRTAA